MVVGITQKVLIIRRKSKMASRKGYFKYALAFDCETTGLALGSLDPSFDEKTQTEYQAVSMGMVVVDMDTLKEIDHLYVEIKWNGVSKWEDQAQKVHGLTRQHLEKNGVSEEEAVVLMGNFLLQYFSPETDIRLIGHNVATFDRYFLARLFKKFNIPLRFGNRHIDTFGIGVVTFGAYNSDDLFEEVGITARGKHNALDDARHALKVIQVINKLFNVCLEE